MYRLDVINKFVISDTNINPAKSTGGESNTYITSTQKDIKTVR